MEIDERVRYLEEFEIKKQRFEKLAQICAVYRDFEKGKKKSSETQEQETADIEESKIDFTEAQKTVDLLEFELKGIIKQLEYFHARHDLEIHGQRIDDFKTQQAALIPKRKAELPELLLELIRLESGFTEQKNGEGLQIVEQFKQEYERIKRDYASDDEGEQATLYWNNFYEMLKAFVEKVREEEANLPQMLEVEIPALWKDLMTKKASAKTLNNKPVLDAIAQFEARKNKLDNSNAGEVGEFVMQLRKYLTP